MVKRLSLPLLSSLAVLWASPAFASFHLMKIEQAMGGVSGDTTQQAVQLRLRSNGQNLLGGVARIRAWDAAGANPVTLIAFPSNVASGLQGRRVLVVSTAFAATQTGITADFTMTNTIPASYLTAGRLTFEDTGGTVYWSLAWGGAGYTGSNTGTMTNDADGNFGPPFGSALPSSSTSALQFNPLDTTGGGASTNNAADYTVTAGAAVFTNNAGQSGTVMGAQANLGIVKADSPDPVAALQALAYTLSVSNAGPSAATSVSVVDTLPAGTTFQSAGGTGWACNAVVNTVTCTRASLAVGAAPIITIVVTAPATSGTITNTATVASAETDPMTANNTDSEDTTVNMVTPQADLSIVKTDGGLEGRWGQPLTYTIVASNAGPAAASGATVSDTFPGGGLTNVTWTCTATSGSSCTASGVGDISSAVTLLSGGTATFTATGTVVVGAVGPLVNTANITAPGDVIDPNTTNNASTETTPVGPIEFYTVTPCRLADTRGAIGPTGGPALQANSTRTFAVAGSCGIPTDARAVAITLTVLQETQAGNLRMYPTGEPLPTASTINFVPNFVRANNAVLKLGTGGQIDVRCDMAAAGSTHFLFDAFGYFR